MILFSVSDNLSLDTGPFIFSLTGKQIKNIDTRRLLPWYKNMLDITNSEKHKTEVPAYWDSFGASEKDLFSKYSNVFILKYRSDSFEEGYAILSEISDLVLDEEDRAAFIKVITTNIYSMNTKPKVMDLYFNAFSCPRLLLSCPAKPMQLFLSSSGKSDLQSNYQMFSVDLQNSGALSSDWIDFKSIHIGDKDKMIK